MMNRNNNYWTCEEALKIAQEKEKESHNTELTEMDRNNAHSFLVQICADYDINYGDLWGI